MSRQKIIKAGAFVSHYLRLSRLLEQLNRKHGGLILAYHEISKETLQTQLTQISRSYEFVTVHEFIQRISAGKSTVGLAAITYDDGLAYEIEEASGLASKYGWPMTFFLPTGALDKGKPYWFQELGELLKKKFGNRLINFNRFEIYDDPDFIKEHEKINQVMVGLHSEDEVENEMKKIRLELKENGDKVYAGAPQVIGWDRVRDLARRRELSFESHSVNHLAMGALDGNKILYEMTASKKRIEEVTGISPSFFCYPYGGEKQIGILARKISAKIYKAAVTLDSGRCGSGSDLFYLPRLGLYEHDTAEILELKMGLAR